MLSKFPAGRLAVGLLVMATVGCDGTGSGGTVSGTVVHNGAPVTSGSVNFVSPTGTAAIAAIDDSGKYAIEGELEPGEYTVYVSPPEPPPPAPGVVPPPRKAFPVPRKFQAAESSGVRVTVKPGSNDDLMVELKG